MPGGDLTGPLGEGPMTGRQLGYGAGFNSPGFMQRFGFGRGRGRGFGFRDRNLNFHQDIIPSETELNNINNDLSILKKNLNSLIEKFNEISIDTRLEACVEVLRQKKVKSMGQRSSWVTFLKYRKEEGI